MTPLSVKDVLGAWHSSAIRKGVDGRQLFVLSPMAIIWKQWKIVAFEREQLP